MVVPKPNLRARWETNSRGWPRMGARSGAEAPRVTEFFAEHPSGLFADRTRLANLATFSIQCDEGVYQAIT